MPQQSITRSRRRLKVAAAVSGTTVLAVAALTASSGSSLAASPAAKKTAGSVSFPGSVPGWATHANDTGATAADTTVEGEVFLPLKNLQAAQALALAVSTPGSKQFHKFLTPSQWISAYAPSQSDLSAVENYITSKGLTISGAPASREYVVFRGPASVVQAAFSTSLHNYTHAGKQLAAPSSVPALPTSVGSLVSGVSLDQGSTLTRPTDIKQDTASADATKTSTPTPSAAPAKGAPAYPVAQCSPYWDANEVTLPKAYGRTSFPTNICGYTGSQLTGAYGIKKLLTRGIDGTGQTVAIVDAYSDPTIVGDTDNLDGQTGTTPLNPSQFTNISFPTSKYDDVSICQGISGWQAEESIDVQSVHALAPGAKILYSGGFDCEGGLDLALSKIIDGHLATIVSNSYGNAGENLPDNTLVGDQSRELQAAAEGIGLYFSSGDNGDEAADIGYVSADFEASSPYVTAVGGTSLAVSSGATYEFETGWGTTRNNVVLNSKGTGYVYQAPIPGDPAVPGSFYFGAGGGTSVDFDEPAYQQGVVPTSLSTGSDGSTGRVVPDISSLADPYTGFMIGISPYDDSTGQTGAYETDTYGGTSLASPLTAAQVALAQAVTGSTIGFANPGIYALAKNTPTAFRDINPTTTVAAASTGSTGITHLETYNLDSSLTTAKGYDNVTGVGSATVTGLEKVATGTTK